MNLKKLSYILFALVLIVFTSCGDTYTVTYDGNGSTSGTAPVDTNNYEEGATVTVASVGSLVKTDNVFTGWNTATDGSGTARATGSTFAMGTENLTLYAQWTTNPTYTVSYDGNGSDGGTVPIDTNNYEEGATVTVAGVETLTKTGKTFFGWNTAADGSGTAHAAASTFEIGTANVILYAQWVTSLLAIGDAYQGGIVAYILQAEDPGYTDGEQHGLIAATVNQSTGAPWGCDGTLIGTTGTTLGTGQANTTAILGACADPGIAAKLCYDYSTGDNSDLHSWYLPSQDELAKLYAMKVLGFGGFAAKFYWSSSEVDAGFAWNQFFNNGFQDQNIKGFDIDIYVRCVRSF